MQSFVFLCESQLEAVSLMPSSDWFVQTIFGTLLGPMPKETLSEMARTDALLSNDLVRQGTDGDWQPASKVSGLFPNDTKDAAIDVVTTAIVERSSDRIVTTAPAVHASTSLNAVRMPEVAGDSNLSEWTEAISGVELAAGEADTRSEMETLSDQPVPKDDLIANWKAERSQKPPAPGLVSLAHEIEHESDEPLVKPRSRQVDEALSSGRGEEVRSEKPTSNRPLKSPKTAPITPTQESFAQQSQRWRRSMLAWPKRIACGLVLFFLWSQLSAMFGTGESRPAYPTARVAGMVKLDGKPIVKGKVQFAPQKATLGEVVSAEIKNGQFNAAYVPIGKHCVLFIAVEETGRMTTDSSTPQPEIKNIIPEKYRDGWELTIQGNESNRLFDLTSK